jgi:HD-GYP domain-containing protein (c-di-GMP phosphodiesterase class II)
MPLHEEECEANDSDFVAVRISEFYSPRRVAFDVYLKLGKNKYLKVFRAGEEYSETELKAYEADRGVRFVYFEKAFRPLYISTSTALLQKLAPLAGVPTRAKFGVARILSELYLQELFLCDDETRPAAVEQGKKICSVLAAWIEAEPGLESFLLELDQTEPSVEALSFLVGVFSSMISKRFPWKSRRTTETLLLASFFCDLGVGGLPPELAKIPPKRMNPAQLKKYEMHPELSYLMLQELGSLHENVLLIVRQHHEYCDGSGFPQKLPANEILMLAKVVCLAGDLVRTTSEYLLPPKDAAKVMFPILSKKAFTSYPELVAKYDRSLLEAFFEIFGEKKKTEDNAA